ncbi:MAG: 3-isopropylmalate dehydrogenase [Alphaproteobacteria bacterium]|nr:3-isopropylmalate dehydrogenase [Alphaproteobacteria bacterium]
MYKIAVLKGDGIGPEIVNEAIKVLKKTGEVLNIEFEFNEALIGGCAYEKFGTPLPNETIQIAKKSDAVLLGAVGDWKYDTLPPEVRPERALLGIRKELNLFANLRPVVLFDELLDASSLKPEIIRGTDVMIVRELTGDVYFGTPKGIEVRLDENGNGVRYGYNNMIYSEKEIERIAHVAFSAAQTRNKKLCSVDKANVLDVSRLWREIMIDVSKQYPDVELTHMYVDNAAMQLVANPKQFDTIVTGNIFGDILSDEASMISGSLGLLASASLSDDGCVAMYEPIHGSAPDLKGLNVANPIATILSAAMMMKYSFKNEKAFDLIFNAIKSTLKGGYRTKDIYKDGDKLVSTSQMGDVICSKI